MATKTTKTKTKTKKQGSGLPLIKQPGDITYDPITGEQISLDPFADTDTSFDYNQISAGKVSAGSVKAGTLADRFMTAADYTVVDPSQIASEYGDINREQMTKNAELSSKLALDALDTELQGLTNFAPAASALKRGEIAKDNVFNQAQRDEQIAAADPNLKSDLEGQRTRATAFAEGRLPSSIDDRAFELGIRSRAADSANAGGFGSRSSAAKKASALMSSEQRVALSQYGDTALTNNIGNRAKLLLADTQYSDAGSQIKTTPTISGAQAAMQIASEANAGNITADKALSSLTQQGQFKAGLEQDTNKTNVTLAAQKDLNQVQLDLQADTSNVDRQLQADTVNTSNDLRAQEVNASNAIDTQKTSMTIKSQESQFKGTQEFNVKNSNANRTFEAANANAGRALDVAKDNRNVKLQVETSNKQMIFQDQQARKAEAAANSRAAMSAAASRANAALSYKSNQESLAANMQLQREKMAFDLQQQQGATDAYKEGVKRQQDAQDLATAGTIISRTPSIIKGVGDTINSLGDIYNSTFGDSSSSSEAIGQNSDGSYIFAA